MKNLIIRKATEYDVEDIYRLIVELAVFEKEPDSVKISVDELREDGFGESPSYSCIIAEFKEQVIGFALYYYRYSTWNGKSIYLEDFVVESRSRNLGAGKLLFDHLLEIAKAEKVRQLYWQVLDWNKDAIRFYDRYNAEYEDHWLNARISFDK